MPRVPPVTIATPPVRSNNDANFARSIRPPSVPSREHRARPTLAAVPLPRLCGTRGGRRVTRASDRPRFVRPAFLRPALALAVGLAFTTAAVSAAPVGAAARHRSAPATAPSRATARTATLAAGYDIVDTLGGVYNFGAPSFGNLLGHTLAAPILGMAQTTTKGGYWLVGNDGGIFACGNAPFHGSTGAIHLAQPIVGIARTPSGNDGYWMVAADGGVFSFGTASYKGSAAGRAPVGTVVGLSAVGG